MVRIIQNLRAILSESLSHLCCRRLESWLYSPFPFPSSCKYPRDSSTICHTESEFRLSLVIPELPEISCLARASLQNFWGMLNPIK